ncbi:MAG: hypothetical protein AAFQ05_00090 [Pseudomonadota bacterium]
MPASALATVNPSGLKLGPRDTAERYLPLLNRLRFLSARCRSAARLDLFKACALLSDPPEKAGEGFATALVRTLGQALDHPPVFFAPGRKDRSFDEDWLLRVIERTASGDSESVAFLLRRRVANHHTHALAFLISGYVETALHQVEMV